MKAQIRIIRNGLVLVYYRYYDTDFTSTGMAIQERLKQYFKDMSKKYYGNMDEAFSKSFMTEFQMDCRDYELSTEILPYIEYLYVCDFDKNEFTGYWLKDFELKEDSETPWFKQMPSEKQTIWTKDLLHDKVFVHGREQ